MEKCSVSRCLAANFSVSYSTKKFNCKCSNCKQYKKESTVKYAEAARERSKRWREENKDRLKQKYKIKYEESKKEVFKKQSLTKFSISPEEFLDMLSKQSYKCKICGQENSDWKGRRRLCIDHSHTTNKVRGLLCGNCNIGLGNFKDSPTLLLTAARYLMTDGDCFKEI